MSNIPYGLGEHDHNMPPIGDTSSELTALREKCERLKKECRTWRGHRNSNVWQIPTTSGEPAECSTCVICAGNSDEGHQDYCPIFAVDKAGDLEETATDKPVFVFGSNRLGVHGAGAALCAKNEHGAELGVGEGPTGNAYAIPTKETPRIVLPLKDIKEGVERFLAYARANVTRRFQVTAIGTGLAGYSHEQIAPMFVGAPANVELPKEWDELLSNTQEKQ